jgi:hypothetical protein
MTRYLLIARQERGILDGTAPIETFDEVRGKLVAGKDCLRSACSQRVQSASRGAGFPSRSTLKKILAPGVAGNHLTVGEIFGVNGRFN